MGSTYLELTNKLLGNIGEPLLSVADFANARSIHREAKQSINYGLERIYGTGWIWPFSVVEDYALQLTVGQNNHTLPADCRLVQWDNILLQGDTSLDVSATRLPPKSYHYWQLYGRETDARRSASDYAVPTYVYKNLTGGLGVSPQPDKQYTLLVSYYKSFSPLVNATDTTDVPTAFDNVIQAGAQVRMAIFRQNAQEAQLLDSSFKELLKNMRSLLINDERTRMMDSGLVVRNQMPYDNFIDA